VSGEPMSDGAGRFKGYRGVGSDITERKRMERELHDLATTDALTGLANRRHFVARLEHELARVHRLVNPPVSVLMIDLDHFKRVNDRYGHPVGDALLKHCATVVGDCARKMDLIGRMGGEEFAILLPGTDLDSACSFAERLCTTLANTPLQHDGLTITVTASIGVAEMSVVDAGTSDVLKRADAALYRAKEGGRNRVARQDDV
jgi:diguanylate cyclase (GGDEF)-like protein